MNSCAICLRPIYMAGLCTKHWGYWTVSGTLLPDWLKYMISDHRSWEYLEGRFYENETVTSDLTTIS